jgi:hypothetical protein
MTTSEQTTSEPTTQPARLSIVINQHTFTLPRSFSAGHVLSDDEAYALNQVLIENIRNNVRAMVARITGPDGYVSASEQEVLQDRINRYVLEYRFRSRTKNRMRSAVEIAIDELARNEAELAASHSGIELNSPDFQDIYQTFRQDPDVSERAKELVSRRRQIVEAATEELF